MTRLMRMVAVGGIVAALGALTALAQYPSEVVGFNGSPIDDPATCQEMFRIPQVSGSTVGIIPNTAGAYDYNGAYRASGLQTEGAAAMQVYFNWVDPADPCAWVRLTTLGGPLRPNPALHTLGKVRFKITNRSELFQGQIGICLGIRETGVEVPQMWNGGSSGEIEWVGVSTTPNAVLAGPDMIVDTTAAGDDVQEYPVGTDIGPTGLDLPTGTAVVSPGTNGILETTPAGDDLYRRGYTLCDGARKPIPALTLPTSVVAVAVEWDLATGVVKLNGVPQGGGLAGFTGNGQMDLVPHRGTLEHIAFVNVAADPAVLIDVAIDELQFEAPEADPVLAPTIIPPILPNATQLTITDLMNGAESAALYLNDVLQQSQPLPSPTPTDFVFTIPSAQPGQSYKATQTKGGVESPFSDPVNVTFSAHKPTIFAAPAAGDTVVKVLDINTASTLVSVYVNGTEYNDVPDPGADRWDVSVPPLAMGDTVTAMYWVGLAPSVESAYETVTTDTVVTTLLNETFETYATQGEMEGFWTQGNTTYPAQLVTDMNATCPSGTQAVLTPATPTGSSSWMYHAIAQTTPTETNPVILNVNIYDPIGIDPDTQEATQWVELNYLGGPDWFFIHVGFGWEDAAPSGNWYQFRAVGHAGPNWIELNQFDAPQRSIGWHTFTVVHKGPRIDVYVDGLLAYKNVQLNTSPVTYARADCGGGYASAADVWIDDFIADVGPVWFGAVCEAPAVCRGDANCDGIISWRDIDFFVAAMNDNVTAWTAMFPPPGPSCDFGNNDVNADGTVSWRDIDALVAVMNTVCP